MEPLGKPQLVEDAQSDFLGVLAVHEIPLIETVLLLGSVSCIGRSRKHSGTVSSSPEPDAPRDSKTP